MANFGFVFPGQGSQSVGMLKELSELYPVIKNTFAEASEVLGYDLFDLVMNGPAEELGKTYKTQPALLTASVALYRLWQEKSSLKPAVMAGHSLGEYSALVCAGVIDFKDAVKLVKLRGEFMQAAVPAGVGAMAAVIGLADDVVIKACAEAAGSQVCSAVNFNSPGQVVIAGNKEAVDKASEALKAAGAKRVLPLAVSVPSHCALMKSAADELAKELAKVEFRVPSVPVINNVDVAKVTDADSIRDALVRQLYSPVRWVETVQSASAEGIKTMIEVGPGKVLSGLIKRIDKEVNAISLNDAATLDAALAAVA
ncbi:MAG: ACP S-malonyltransferase [Ruminobacter sp.]|jgi:[acyl-carrier-protein] S-malonyltransferase|uniref:Malonyl CoA-acyl carrier protein transacylase n=1 Tax=Ruminobacter amylophilus TaxID=867 RepID=A0A662ZI93_9GAMM|nr:MULTISPECIES: ACP S-malonyltransferase [Ruminobacter]MBQ3775925.1 ACP S-malonyltransferase [Ruminobacter sp.]SFP30945.1 [acyl-carrier-protein] S-malonyltransferase [Ruminobacter amylophilus]